MEELHVGDSVVVVDAAGKKKIKNGETHVVSKIFSHEFEYMVVELVGLPGYQYLAMRFQKSQEMQRQAAPAPAQKEVFGPAWTLVMWQDPRPYMRMD